MDYLHYILVFVIIILILLNNINIIRKYYYPWFFSILKKVTKYFNSHSKNNILPKKDFKPESVKKSEMYSNFSFDKLKEIQRKLSWKYQIAVLNLNCNLNVGAIYRSGCLLGMDKYVILGKKIYNPKSQVGLDYVPIEYLDAFKSVRDRYDPSTVENFNVKVFLSYLKKNNLRPILIEQGGKNLLKINFKKLSETLELNEKFIFVFGNETHGIPKNLLELACNEKWLILTIPQWGCAHSFNVSQASNIIMWKFYNDHISHTHHHKIIL